MPLKKLRGCLATKTRFSPADGKIWGFQTWARLSPEASLHQIWGSTCQPATVDFGPKALWVCRASLGLCIIKVRALSRPCWARYVDLQIRLSLLLLYRHLEPPNLWNLGLSLVGACRLAWVACCLPACLLACVGCLVCWLVCLFFACLLGLLLGLVWVVLVLVWVRVDLLSVRYKAKLTNQLTTNKTRDSNTTKQKKTRSNQTEENKSTQTKQKKIKHTHSKQINKGGQQPLKVK